MAKKLFELNKAGVMALLKGPEMQGILKSYADQKAAQAGPGYIATPHMGQRRAYVNIHPGTKEAAHDNWDHNTLVKVIKS